MFTAWELGGAVPEGSVDAVETVGRCAERTWYLVAVMYQEIRDLEKGVAALCPRGKIPVYCGNNGHDPKTRTARGNHVPA